MTIDKIGYDDVGSRCNTCGTNYYERVSFCSVCGSIDLDEEEYNRDGVSGSLMCFENFITDTSKYKEVWENIIGWFQRLDNIILNYNSR